MYICKQALNDLIGMPATRLSEKVALPIRRTSTSVLNKSGFTQESHLVREKVRICCCFFESTSLVKRPQCRAIHLMYTVPELASTVHHCCFTTLTLA
jgi:hypothetical protein